jgi:mannitol/fructose-specific phosphotransferase system IIA component (Ntr-type)
MINTVDWFILTVMSFCIGGGVKGKRKMNFADFVCFPSLKAGLEADDRDLVIAELVNSLAEAGALAKTKAKDVAKEVVKRENEASTGMGKGIAIPHVKHSSVKKVIATVGCSSKGIDFNSLDKQPVYSVILVLSPVNDPDKHLQAMESIFRHLQQERFLKFLRQSVTNEDIEDLLREADENPTL